MLDILHRCIDYRCFLGVSHHCPKIAVYIFMLLKTSVDILEEIGATSRRYYDGRSCLYYYCYRLPGKISPIISHGMGPKPMANPMIKNTKLTNGSHPY